MRDILRNAVLGIKLGSPNILFVGEYKSLEMPVRRHAATRVFVRVFVRFLVTLFLHWAFISPVSLYLRLRKFPKYLNYSIFLHISDLRKLSTSRNMYKICRMSVQNLLYVPHLVVLSSV